MKQINFYVILLTSIFSFCQNNNYYSVVYKVSNINFELQADKKSKLIDAIKKEAASQEFQLDYNRNQCHFYELENLQSDIKVPTEVALKKLAKIRFTCDFNYFFDKTNSIEFFEKENGIVIKNSYLTKNWEITSESKVIDKYLCYKAVYKYDYIGRDNKTKTREIIAWFTPSIPFSYGPKNYNGLPGLIIELTDLYTTFLAVKIGINDDIIIRFPKGKTITQEEYEKKILGN